jgi:hypothetical protein
MDVHERRVNIAEWLRDGTPTLRLFTRCSRTFPGPFRSAAEDGGHGVRAIGRGTCPQDASAGRPSILRIPMRTEDTFTCATCDHDIVGHPVFHLGLAFCCPGCAADGPCMCSYDTVDPDPPAIGLVDPAEDALVEPVGGQVFAEPAVREPVAATAKDGADQLVGAAR